MDPVVTARVPAGVRARGSEVLREIGATTSELVNAAFAYVIQERELPKPKSDAMPASGSRALSEKQARELAAFIGNVHIPVPESWSDAPFEELFATAMEERHADLR